MNDVLGGILCDAGTSYATAYVTAVAALLSEEASSRDPRKLKARLIATAEWSQDYAGIARGGLINAGRALELIHKHVLKVKGPGATDLKLKVELPQSGAGGIKAFGTENGQNRTTVIPWSHVLRLQRLPDAPGATPMRFRISFVDNTRFAVLDEALILEGLVLPFKVCATIADASVTCEGMSISRVVDYVAALYPDDLFSF